MKVQQPHTDICRSKNVDLSVIVPIRNESPYIDALMEDLLDQTLSEQRYEVLVVDGQSSDDSLQKLRAWAAREPRVLVLENPARRASVARNIGARAARGMYLLFVDGHCRVPSKTMLEDALAAFERGVECLSRPQPLKPMGTARIAQAIVQTRSSPLGHMPGSLIYSALEKTADPLSAGCGYTRALYQDVGGFDERFDAVEDVDFNARVRRLNVPALHSPRFAVEYLARPTWRQLWRQMSRYGVGRARLLRKDPSTFSVWTVGSALMILAAGTVAVGAWFAPSLWDDLTFLGAVSLSAALGCGAVVGRRAGLSVALLSIPTFFVIHAALGLGFLIGLIQGSGLLGSRGRFAGSARTSPVGGRRIHGD